MRLLPYDTLSLPARNAKMAYAIVPMEKVRPTRTGFCVRVKRNLASIGAMKYPPIMRNVDIVVISMNWRISEAMRICCFCGGGYINLKMSRIETKDFQG